MNYIKPCHKKKKIQRNRQICSPSIPMADLKCRNYTARPSLFKTNKLIGNKEKGCCPHLTDEDPHAEKRRTSLQCSVLESRDGFFCVVWFGLDLFVVVC